MVAGGIFSTHEGIAVFPVVYFSLVCFHQAQVVRQKVHFAAKV